MINGSNPDFDDVSVLHVQLSRRLAVCHFGAVELKADVSLGGDRHLGQILGEDGAQRCLLKNNKKNTHGSHDWFVSCC